MKDTRAGGVSGQLLPPGGYDAEGYDFAGTWGDSVTRASVRYP